MRWLMKVFGNAWSTGLVVVLLAGSIGCSGAGEQTRETDASDKVEEQTQFVEANEEAHASGEHQAEKHQSEKHGEGHGHGAEPHGHRFENPEKWAENWNDPARDEWQKPGEVAQVMELGEGMTVVDLGAGTGYFVEPLASEVGPDGKVVALDIEQSMVDFISELAGERGLENVEARKVAVDDPGLESESVDRILTVNTWHHIPKRAAYGRKLYEALTPGGKLAVVDYTKEATQGPPKEMRLAPEQVAEELRLAGFEAKIADETLPKQYIVIGTKPKK
ncbi:class I SAM-dependent methyltransferase [Persicimonas caeni]|uniref:Class I SAM-dependent methyltransferase n=2 Tax=Persicimonas caeni TaxID=2292766 RepID=A0A4Y6PQJ1_PERCE|nr:class I SAM-dependent methyltransferase [Persicimonas caeni]QED31704.1 class I SAM-dependent methyltransferase [Persicimonas caeni]